MIHTCISLLFLIFTNSNISYLSNMLTIIFSECKKHSEVKSRGNIIKKRKSHPRQSYMSLTFPCLEKYLIIYYSFWWVFLIENYFKKGYPFSEVFRTKFLVLINSRWCLLFWRSLSTTSWENFRWYLIVLIYLSTKIFSTKIFWRSELLVLINVLMISLPFDISFEDYSSSW